MSLINSTKQRVTQKIPRERDEVIAEMQKEMQGKELVNALINIFGAILNLSNFKKDFSFYMSKRRRMFLSDVSDIVRKINNASALLQAQKADFLTKLKLRRARKKLIEIRNRILLVEYDFNHKKTSKKAALEQLTSNEILGALRVVDENLNQIKDR